MKKEKIKNYLPHAGIETIDRVSEEHQYLVSLSRVVGTACDKWLEAKGLKNGFRHDFSYGKMKSPAQNVK